MEKGTYTKLFIGKRKRQHLTARIQIAALKLKHTHKYRPACTPQIAAALVRCPGDFAGQGHLEGAER
jgi:hypothetical protein